MEKWEELVEGLVVIRRGTTEKASCFFLSKLTAEFNLFCSVDKIELRLIVLPEFTKSSPQSSIHF